MSDFGHYNGGDDDDFDDAWPFAGGNANAPAIDLTQWLGANAPDLNISALSQSLGQSTAFGAPTPMTTMPKFVPQTLSIDLGTAVAPRLSSTQGPENSAPGG